MTMREMIQQMVQSNFQTSPFNASEVQSSLPEDKAGVHISRVRNLLGEMVKEGSLHTTGKGKNKKYTVSVIDQDVEVDKEDSEVEDFISQLVAESRAELAAN